MTLKRNKRLISFRLGVWVLSVSTLACRPSPVDPDNEFRTLMTTVADAWSSQDTSSALECFTPDAVYTQPPDQQLYRGAIELARLFDAIEPGTRMAFHHLALDPSRQMGFGEFTFGRPDADSAVHGVVVVTLEDGRIATWREYFESGPASFDAFVAIEDKDWKWTAEDLR